jgi:ATP-dependent DNA ligase
VTATAGMARANQTHPRIAFIKSTECLPVKQLPRGKEWSYEIKLDGFRLESVKKNGDTTLYSRRGNILNRKFQYIASALKTLPDNTALDGEAGMRSGLWQKYRINLLQEFVVGGYSRGANGFDALIVGFYRSRELLFAARVRAALCPPLDAKSSHG